MVKKIAKDHQWVLVSGGDIGYLIKAFNILKKYPLKYNSEYFLLCCKNTEI
jgi:hypothetical protein